MKAEEKRLIELNKEEIEIAWSAFLKSPKSIFLQNSSISKIEYHKSIKASFSNCYGMTFSISGVYFTVGVPPEQVDFYFKQVQKNLNIDSIKSTPDSLLVTIAENFRQFISELGIYSITSSSEIDIHPLIQGISSKTFKDSYEIELTLDVYSTKIFIENYDSMSRGFSIVAETTKPSDISKNLADLVDEVDSMFDSLENQVKETLPASEFPTVRGTPYNIKSKKFLTSTSLNSLRITLDKSFSNIETAFQQLIGNRLSLSLEKFYEDSYRYSELKNSEDTFYLECICEKGSFYIEVGSFGKVIVDHLCGSSYSYKNARFFNSFYTETEKLLIADFFNSTLQSINKSSSINFSHCANVKLASYVTHYLTYSLNLSFNEFEFLIPFIFPLPTFIDILTPKIDQNSSQVNTDLIKNIQVPLIIRYEDQPIIQSGVLQHFQPNIFIPLGSKKIIVVEKDTMV